MHLYGIRTVRRALYWLLWRPATELGRRTSIPRVLRPAWFGRPTPTVPLTRGLRSAEWWAVQRSLSECTGGFFSDNLVSNESSYLQPAAELERLPKGLAYVGVGPEQNFSYLALLEPALAFIVDVRRDNARVHWLYQALFEESAGRAEFLALLLGRPYDSRRDPGPEAPLARVIELVERGAPSEASFAAAHRRVVARLETSRRGWSRRDRRALERLHRSFFTQQLAASFQLRGSRHQYPSLRSLLLAASPDGRSLSFLGSDQAFQVVRRLEQDHRIIPVVGRFAGSHALAGIAASLHAQALPLGVLYTSNVEQYVFEDRDWGRWIANLERFPRHASTVVVRSYLDQGCRHPRQLPGHRMTSLVQPLEPFLTRNRLRPYRSYWQVVTDPALAQGSLEPRHFPRG